MTSPPKPDISAAAVGASPAASLKLKRRYSYDEACATLAEYFLDGLGPPISQSDIDELAQDFQDAAEAAVRRLAPMPTPELP